MAVLLVGIGGFIGAVARYGLASLVQRWGAQSFPWGTLAVNVTGCVGIGALLYLVEERLTLGDTARLFWGVGLLGGFTTFSAFGHETFSLLRTGRFGAAAAYVTASLALGLASVWLGRALLKLAAP